MTLRRVLVPLDGAPFAEAALPLAAHVARRHGATLHLVVVHDPPVPGSDAVAALAVALQGTARGYLRAVASRLDPAGTLAHEVDVLQGPVGPTLSAASSRADLVVMATHGRGALRRVWLGGVADYVLRHAAAPVLLVRPTEVPATFGAVRLSRVLVPLDASRASEAALAAVKAVVGTPVKFTLLQVIEPALGLSEPAVPYPVPMDPTVLAEVRAAVGARLARVAASLRAEGHDVVTKVVTGAGPAAAILEESRAGSYDLVAMTTQGQGGIGRLLLGSVAYRVVRGSESPVLALRPPAHLAQA